MQYFTNKLGNIILHKQDGKNRFLNVEKAVLLYPGHLTRLCKTVHAWAGVSQTQSIKTKNIRKIGFVLSTNIWYVCI
jgi:hypothetical protein